MNAWMKKLAMAGLVAAAATVVGCRETREVENDDVELGTGGAGQGDDDIGRTEGVLNDGEGPLEENNDDRALNDAEREMEAEDDSIGRREGVLDDGEGPLEERNEDVTKDENVGKKPGVLNDGEGPLEERQ
jgi:hypothetical protein